MVYESLLVIGVQRNNLWENRGKGSSQSHTLWDYRKSLASQTLDSSVAWELKSPWAFITAQICSATVVFACFLLPSLVLKYYQDTSALCLC